MTRISVKILLPIIFISGILLFLDFEAGDTSSSLEDLAQDEYIGLKVKPLVLDDQVIDFPFTDDNTNESIIIKSDKKVYYGLSEADVYTSLTNTTSQPQRTVLLFYFSKSKGEVATVAEVDDNKLRFINFFKDNIKVKESLLEPALKKRASIPVDFKAKAATQIALAPNETIYIKSQIQYYLGSTGEFWIEALGENGGYGLLDPWYAPPVLIKGGVKIKGGVTVGKVDQGDTSTVAAGITAPTFDATNLTTITDSSLDSASGTHTVPSGTDLLVVMLQGWVVGNTTPPSSITWNGVNLTRITLSCGSSTWAYDQQGLWYLVNPTSGTNGTISISGGAALNDGGIIHIFNLSGVDTTVGTSGIRSHNCNSSDTRTTITNSPTTASGDLIISQWSQQGSTSTTGQTYGGTSGTQSVKNGTGFNVDAAFLTTSIPTASGQTVTFLETAAGTFPSGLSISVAGE